MKRVIAVGEIMARFSSPGYLRLSQCMPGKLEVLFAGAEASVAMSIAYLGGAASFVTALPEHAIADACIQTLRAVGVEVGGIVRSDRGRLGLYFLEAGVNQRPAQVIYDREGASFAITSPEAYDWEAIYSDADWLVISGITPAISAIGYEVAQVAIAEAVRRGVRVLFDFNYRAKLWRWDPSQAPRDLAIRTIRELLPCVNLFVGGADELAELLGAASPEIASGDPRGDFLRLARGLVARYPQVEYVASTARKSRSASHHQLGGMLYDVRSDALYLAPLDQVSVAPWGPAYEIDQMVDRIGTGDAFTAGLLFALRTPGWSEPARAIAFATAAFCLSHSVHGDFHCSSRAEIEALVAGDSSGRVRR